MDRLRRFLSEEQWRPAPAYEPLIRDPGEEGDGDDAEASRDVDHGMQKSEFSWLVYGVFCLLGVAMLWAW